MPALRVGPLPPWLDAARLLGPGFSEAGDGWWEAELAVAEAADVAARLRGVGLAGRALAVQCQPPLKRAAVRAGRTRDARARRDTTPGFTHNGARLDAEGRMSLTPEALALELGRRYAGRRLLDLTCGAGGNAIGFARAGCAVTAVELDASRLADARHNARLYSVADRITFVQGDARHEVGRPAEVVFADVPWGADWDRTRCTPEQLPLLRELMARLEGDPREVVFKVPPSFDPGTTPGFTAEAWFGRAAGDRRRVKFVLLTRGGRER